MKPIESAPGLELASAIAWRSDPIPASAVVVTVKTTGVRRVSSGSSRKARCRFKLGAAPHILRNVFNMFGLLEEVERKVTAYFGPVRLRERAGQPTTTKM
jgi:hypothetical protein